MPVPVHRRASPAHREDAVDNFGGAVTRAIAQRGEVGDQSDVPEKQRHSGVGGDGKAVPYQRAAELRPHFHRVGIGEQPVGEPGTAKVEYGIQSRAGHREKRHGLGKAVDRSAPLLAQEQQNRGNQRAGVADANPPNEIDDGESPADGDVDAPDADAFGKKVRHGNEQEHYQEKCAGKSENPPFRRTAGEHDGADLVGDA